MRSCFNGLKFCDYKSALFANKSAGRGFATLANTSAVKSKNMFNEQLAEKLPRTNY